MKMRKKHITSVRYMQIGANTPTSNVFRFSICQTVGVQPGGSADETLCEANLDAIYSTLFEALKDYTLDSRGDVGAW